MLEERSFDARDILALYDELRKIAACLMAKERSDHTLQPTALVHETFIAEQAQVANDPDYELTLANCVQTMKRKLIEHQRKHDTKKRGGDREKLDLIWARDENESFSNVELDDALQHLRAHEPMQAQAIELRYRSFYSAEETAAVLCVSRPTVNRLVRKAKLFLYEHLKD